MPMVPKHCCADSRTPGRFVLPLLAVALALLLPASANALEGDAPGWAGLAVGGVAVLVILLGAALLFRFSTPLSRQLKESEGEARAVVPKGSRYYREGHTRLVALSILLAVGAFALDLSLPLGVAGAVPYVALVLVSLSLPHRKHTLAAATLASVLTVLGFFFSPAGGILWVVLANRSLALFAIWVTATLGLLHKQAEEAVRRSEASLANAQRIAHLGNWDWDVVSNELYWSDEMYRIFGTHPQSFGANYEAFLSTVHPDDRERVKKAVSESLYEGKPYNIEYRIVLPDGAERIGHAQGEVNFDQAGKPIRMVGTVLDITDHKRGDQQLETSRARFRGILDAASDAVISVNEDRRIVLFNKQAENIFGYAAEEILGRPLELLLPTQFRRGHENYVSKFATEDATQRRMGVALELSACRKDGQEIPVEISISKLDLEGRQILTAIVRDITERKRAEEQIKASLREKEVLLQEIHHRVKNNLQVIVSLLNLQAARVTDKQAREMFTESRSRVRAIALMHETLYQSKDLSRIDFGEYSRTLAANLFASYGVDPEVVSWRINVENGFLGVDAAIPCGLIVSELISNSLKYAFPAGQHGEVCIDFRRDDGNKCILVVKDNGIGLPKEFDLRKLESLGLQLVCTLTDQLDGSLELDCTEGTEFRITFAARRTTERDTDNGQRTNPGSRR